MILASIKMANTVKGKSLVLFSICAVPFFFFLPFSVLEIGPLYLQIPDYPGHYVDQAGGKLTDNLSAPSLECWCQRRAPPCPAQPFL